MNEQSKKLAKEIADQKPSIIIISGSRDRTYSSDTFHEILIIPKNYFRINHPKIHIPFEGDVKKIRQSVDEWVLSTVEECHPEYEITKHTKDDIIAYIVGENYDTEPPYFDEKYKVFSADFGGYIFLEFIRF